MVPPRPRSQLGNQANTVICQINALSGNLPPSGKMPPARSRYRPLIPFVFPHTDTITLYARTTTGA